LTNFDLQKAVKQSINFKSITEKWNIKQKLITINKIIIIGFGIWLPGFRYCQNQKKKKKKKNEWREKGRIREREWGENGRIGVKKGVKKQATNGPIKGIADEASSFILAAIWQSIHTIQSTAHYHLATNQKKRKGNQIINISQ